MDGLQPGARRRKCAGETQVKATFHLGVGDTVPGCRQVSVNFRLVSGTRPPLEALVGSLVLMTTAHAS